MLLTIDIGNTNIVLAVFDEERLVRSWRVSTRKRRTADEYGIICRNLFHLDRAVDTNDILAVAICSVVPPLDSIFKTLSTRYFNLDPYFVDPSRQDLMVVRYKPPSDVGADRIVNAVAARSLVGSPSIVVDFGTATTFDAISPQGEYVGGIIAPGIGISADALFSHASRLPRIDIRQPAQVIGQSTVESIQSGIYYGYQKLVDGIISRMKEDLGPARVVATGGLAPLIAEESLQIESVEPTLTVQGLRMLYEHSTSR